MSISSTRRSQAPTDIPRAHIDSPPDHSCIFQKTGQMRGTLWHSSTDGVRALAGLVWDMAIQADTGYLLVLSLHPPFVFINVLGHDSLVQTCSVHAWPCLWALFWFYLLKRSLFASFWRIRILFTKLTPVDNLGHFQPATF